MKKLIQFLKKGIYITLLCLTITTGLTAVSIPIPTPAPCSTCENTTPPSPEKEPVDNNGYN